MRVTSAGVRVWRATGVGALCVFLVGVGAPAFAQLEAISSCRAEADASAHIACLETALCQTLSSSDDRDACVAELLELPAPVAETVAEPVGEEETAPAERRRFGMFSRGREDEPEAPVVASTSDEAAELGAEQLPGAREQRETERVRVSAVITSFEFRHNDVLQVELDNGQVWRQRDSDSRRVRLKEGDPMQVELWASGFGGHRMRLVEQGVRLRVERIR